MILQDACYLIRDFSVFVGYNKIWRANVSFRFSCSSREYNVTSFVHHRKPICQNYKKQKQETNILKVCQSKQSYVFLTPSHANIFSYSLTLYLFFFAGTSKATKEK